MGKSRKLRKTRKQKGGMPLSYVKPSYVEPSASAGSNILQAEVGLARPVLNPTGGRRSRRNRRGSRRGAHTRRGSRRGSRRGAHTRRGGFLPSVAGHLLKNGAKLIPAAAFTGYKMVNNYKKPQK